MNLKICGIIDFGSQYTQLIARRLRELNVFCKIYNDRVSLPELREQDVQALILSGGPASVNDSGASRLSFSLDELDIPILGICYGMQLMALDQGGEVSSGQAREYGVDQMKVLGSSILLGETSQRPVLMSHGDHISKLPPAFVETAQSLGGVTAAMECAEKNFFGLQFHPEVVHTQDGSEILKSFLLRAGFRFDWQAKQMMELISENVRECVKPHQRVLCAVSGGVDSTVLAVALNKILPGQVDCLCVDTGLLRHREIEELKSLFEDHLHFPIRIVDARQSFLSELKGVLDPEEKRKRIGAHFIHVFEREAKALKDIHFLAQGTLYPDVIESISPHGGPSAKIKSHHNVGGLPERLPFELLEPFRLLFKDEVRDLGEALGMPHDFVWRHPFPGPGLAVRVVGEVTEDRLEKLRACDHRLQKILKEEGLYESLWQSFAVFLPIQSVGVMGDARTYENCVAIRCVHSDDGMTALIADLSTRVLEKISSQIINEVKGINRVVYDISSKPPATIEWE